jgi:hypothetical protein
VILAGAARVDEHLGHGVASAPSISAQIRRPFWAPWKNPGFFAEYDTSRFFVCWWYA